MLSSSAEEKEISPARKHSGITHYQGLMDACILCYEIYILSKQGPSPFMFMLLICTEITPAERWGT